MNRYTQLSLLAIAIASCGAAAYATSTAPENDALALTRARIPLAQAVTLAEHHANGKAARAEYEASPQGGAYEVEVVSGNRVFDVKVDANQGTVMASAEDQADREDEHDEQD
ncbi:MAG: PepSY domain-containing protein [Pseudomonadota bacterium]|nr:PepSY domain-containing protein [Pseudomonadota bacterium]